MSPTTTDPLQRLHATVEQAAAALAANGAAARSRPSLERPKKAQFGDFSTNAAMLLAPVVKASPRDVAERLAGELTGRLGTQLDRAEVAGPGFLNLFLADEWYAGALEEILAAGPGFGGGGAERTERVNVEFVSSNPTGPVHIGHARNAAYGDALSRLLAFHGHSVAREFYVNDAGSQVVNLGRSIRARARDEEIPEDGYHGDYVRDLAAELPDAAEADPGELGRAAVGRMVDRARATLSRFRVADFDSWFYESTLHEGSPSAVVMAFAQLERQGRLYHRDDALWVRTEDLGDDKDRVAVRASGEHTYFASDIAYHWNKHERGFERIIDVWGADHHGYVPRVKAGFAALGGDPERLELLIMQFVNLVRGGERASMSKRAGEFVTLDDLVDEVGVDAARWFLLHRSHDTAVEFDLDLAREQRPENPVYYVQYAHARIASLREKAGAESVAAAAAPGPRTTPLDPAERTLVLKVAAFPGEVAEAADRRAPHRIATYALELAQEFTAFYRDCRVVGAEPAEVEAFRLALCAATQRTIARALDLLGVEAPASM
jgi:arginyl-tRNA synthetase